MGERENGRGFGRGSLTSPGRWHGCVALAASLLLVAALLAACGGRGVSALSTPSGGSAATGAAVAVESTLTPPAAAGAADDAGAGPTVAASATGRRPAATDTPRPATATSRPRKTASPTPKVTGATRSPSLTPRTAQQSLPEGLVVATPRPDEGIATIAYGRLPSEARDTLRLLAKGGPYPYRQDGVVFQNREGLLPHRADGYYHEYTVKTPGSPDRGARRIIAGKQGELYYTADHYASFQRVVP